MLTNYTHLVTSVSVLKYNVVTFKTFHLSQPPYLAALIHIEWSPTDIIQDSISSFLSKLKAYMFRVADPPPLFESLMGNASVELTLVSVWTNPSCIKHIRELLVDFVLYKYDIT